MRSLLLSGPLVRATLEGRKTETRRTVPTCMAKFDFENQWEQALDRCPWGREGEILYCKEPFLVRGDKLVVYRADEPEPWNFRWTPGIEMPRKFSRIMMRNRGVSWGHLQDITPNQIKKEGLYRATHGITLDNLSFFPTFKAAWRALWDGLAAPGLNWESNPRIIRIQYEVVETRSLLYDV